MEGVGQFASAAVVLGLFAFFVWRFRGLRPGSGIPWGRRGTGRLRVLERVALTPQHSLHLVAIGDDTMLIGAGPGGIELLRQVAGGAVERVTGAP